MNRLYVLFIVSYICAPFVVGESRAEDIVSYRVHATSNSEWNLLVNGVTIVRHRPSGFGLSIYSGSINRIVSNGMNTVSILKNDKILSTDMKSGNLEFEIDYIFDYEGKPNYARTLPLLRYSGHSETNLLFSVDSTAKRLSLRSRRLSASERSACLMLLGGIVLYVFFVNLYGFIMVVNDKKYAKNQQVRIPTARFIANVILGGGIGVLLGVGFKRHDMDRKILFVLIPTLMIIQVVLIVFAFSPRGKHVIKTVAPWKPALHLPTVLKESSGFLQSLKRKDPSAE